MYHSNNSRPRDEILLREVHLLHGTKADVLLGIMTEGANERFSGGTFGRGTYFAEDACKNDQYTQVCIAELFC